jgi:excisionase family DNA binding protein
MAITLGSDIPEQKASRMDPNDQTPTPVVDDRTPTPVVADTPLAYRIDAAVQATGLGRTTLYEEIKAGRLRATKVRGRTVILRSDLEQYLLDCRNRRAA